MARRVCPCGICENVNLPSVCTTCINSRLLEKYKLLKRVSRRRDILRMQVEARLKAKHESDQQHHWSISHKDKISKLNEKLQESKIELQKRKEELIKKQQILDAQSHFLAIASAQLAKKQVEQLGQHQPDLVRMHNIQLTSITSELQTRRRFIFRQLRKVYPLKQMSSSSAGGNLSNSQLWTICGAQLPVGDDPQAVSKQDLGASLGYLHQLTQLAAHYLCAPLLHNGHYKGSTSRIWQRSSYWDANSSNSGEYPLFIAAHGSGLSEEHSFSDRGTSIMGFSTIESTGEGRLGDGHASTSRCGSGSMQTLEMHTEVQKGIKILKRSIICVSFYGFNELLLAIPSNMTTFQAFAELTSLLSSKEVKLRNAEHQINSLAGSALSTASTIETRREGRDHKEFKVSIRGNANLNGSFYCIGKDFDHTEGKSGESVLDEWDMVEHITLPPPPSHSEDVEHWTRAMFMDATK